MNTFQSLMMGLVMTVLCIGAWIFLTGGIAFYILYLIATHV